MRRYLLATTLPIASLAAFSSSLQAAPYISSQGALRVAQSNEAPPAGGDAQPKQDEHKGEHKQGPDAGGQKGGGAPAPNGQPAAPNAGRQGGHERGGNEGGQRPPARQAQPQNAPQNPPQSAPQGRPDDSRGRRDDRRERARDEGTPRNAPPREVQAPPTPPPASAQTPQEPRREEHRGRDRDGVRPPPQQAQPQPPPAAPQVQQAQPPAAAAPAPAAQGGTDERGKRGERGDRDRRPSGPASNPPAKQAQPSSPPPAPGPAGPPKGKGAPPTPAQAGTPPPGRGPHGDGRQFGGPTSIDEIKRGRRQRVEDGGKRTVTEEPGNRTIIQEKGAPAMIRHDEGERLSRSSRDVRREKRPDGGSLAIVVRPGGIEVFSEFDSGGRLMRRYRRDRDGRESNLIDNRRFRGSPIILNLGPPRLHIPRERYIMDYERASDDDLYDALMDGPVDPLERGYSLDEIRYNGYLRDRMRRVDLDTVTFEFGAWQVPYDQYQRLERIARIINRILDRRPDEVFLIEGHTDAVGSELDNLTLSDRRAEEVAVILTETFNVPPENLITQGYGEEFLKVPTLAAERANRRVAVRRITPLLARAR